MPRGKKMNEAQRREAAEKLAAGVARREVAEILGVTKRSIERLCADPGFAEEVERARRRLAQADDYNADRRWRRADPQGFREAHDPAMKPEMGERRPATSEEAVDAVRAAQIERARQRITEPLNRELSDQQAQDLWRLNLRFERGRMSREDYDAEYDRIMCHRVPQVRIISMPRTAEALYGWR